MQEEVIHGDIGNIGEELRERFKNAGTMPKKDQITINSQPTCTNTKTTMTRILNF